MVVDTTLYDILEISSTANNNELKKAYHKLSRQLHPDKNTGNEQKFKQMKEAYDILKDPHTRDVYDKTGKTNATNTTDSNLHDIFNVFNFNTNYGTSSGSPTWSSTKSHTTIKKRTQNVIHELYMDLEDLYIGKEKKLKVIRK